MYAHLANFWSLLILWLDIWYVAGVDDEIARMRHVDVIWFILLNKTRVALANL